MSEFLRINSAIVATHGYGGDMRRQRIPIRQFVLVFSMSAVFAVSLASSVRAESIPSTGSADLGRIAYIDQLGDVYTIKPNGTDRRKLASGELLQSAAFTPRIIQSPRATQDAYSWPTWAPGGDRLACFRMILAEAGQTGGLYIFDVASSRVLNVHKDLGLQPIYAYWAPDGQHLAFLRNREQTLSLELWPAPSASFGWQPPKRIADGAPFYFDWRSDAEVLLFHSGGDRQVPSGSSVGLLNIENGTTKIVSPTPASFGAPSWSFDNKWMAYGDEQQAQSPVALMVAPADGGEPQAFADVSQRLALGWSPTESRIVVATTSFMDGSVYEELQLIDIPSGETRTLLKDHFAAYFWSPNGKRILYARRQPGSPFGTWVVVDVDSGKSTDIIDFSPSRPLTQVFQYFDQYALSHRLWSPDSRHFVFAGSAGSDSHPSTALQSPGVYVVEAIPQATPQLLSDGPIAFWSPR